MRACRHWLRTLDWPRKAYTQTVEWLFDIGNKAAERFAMRGMRKP